MTGIVTRENPIRRATCNPAGAGFDRIVEIRPDPDSRIGYPFILNLDTMYFNISHTMCNLIAKSLTNPVRLELSSGTARTLISENGYGQYSHLHTGTARTLIGVRPVLSFPRMEDS